MLKLKEFPDYFRAYHWDGKHSLYGYSADSYDKFDWISSLERRFSWLRLHCKSDKMVSKYLLKEMIQWGGSQNGILQKFEDGIGNQNLQELMLQTIENLDSVEKSISAALKFPGMGLTYASKMLRFLDPERYGALDSRIRKAFAKNSPGALPMIRETSDKSMIAGYIAFTNCVNDIKTRLDAKSIYRPECHLPIGVGPSQWRSADIEMALFVWASSNEP